LIYALIAIAVLLVVMLTALAIMMHNSST